jgi:hypothetical protein
LYFYIAQASLELTILHAWYHLLFLNAEKLKMISSSFLILIICNHLGVIFINSKMYTHFKPSKSAPKTLS